MIALGHCTRKVTGRLVVVAAAPLYRAARCAICIVEPDAAANSAQRLTAASTEED